MYAICVESSHRGGMGHFFRTLNWIYFLKSRGQPYRILINDNPAACNFLQKRNISFDKVSLGDFESDWESKFIKKYSIKVWINDRLYTDIRHSRNVKRNPVKLVAFDDRGSGAPLADLHIAALTFEKNRSLPGLKVCQGLDYLILNPEIDKFKKLRQKSEKWIVTLGGSDPHGATLKVVDLLKRRGKFATVVVGPSFNHLPELKNKAGEDFVVKQSVPSLIEEFSHHDLAVCGGGITPFEANASGLPCIIIANETFEIPNAKFLESLGGSVFAGPHDKINEDFFDKDLDIAHMSRQGIQNLTTEGAENVFRELQLL